MDVKRTTRLPAPVRRVMAKHGLPEPQARLVAALAYGGRTNDQN